MECVIEGLKVATHVNGQASVHVANATLSPLPDDSVDLIVTDPPYYDQVPYATISDFFYVWLKHSVPGRFASIFTAVSTPKDEECVVDEARGKDKASFERIMGAALQEARRIARPDAIGIVIFAHKTTSGWEALLQSVIDAGWVVTASWPLNTELGTRMRAQDSAALASSIHLVIRPRENPDGSLRTDFIGDWRDVLNELPIRIKAWLPRLGSEGVIGADAIFACLGPALEIFSRYSRVEKASGEIVSLREYLEQVWAEVANQAVAMIFAGADTSGFEQDARLTAMWLWTLSANKSAATGAEGDDDTTDDDDDDASAKGKAKGGYSLEYDAARKIAQGLGASLDALKTLVEVKGDTARLLSVSEREGALFPRKGAAKVEAEQAAAKKAKARKKQGELAIGSVVAPEANTATQAATVMDDTDLGTAIVEATMLDRVHQSMLLFRAGRGDALRRFLVDDGVGADQRFWTLAQSLSALYAPGTEEKRWVDGVMARKKGLGL